MISRYGVASNGQYWQLWYVDDNTGQTRKESMGPKASLSKRSAEWKARERIGELNGQVVRGRDAEGPTLSEWIKVRDEQQSELEESSRSVASSALAPLLRYLGESRRMGTVTKVEASGYRAALSRDAVASKWSQSSVNRAVGYAKALFGAAAEQDAINFNPFANVVAGGPGVSAWVYVSAGDVERLFEHCPNNPWRAFFALARFAGLRANEAMSLEWSDIDFAASVMVVHPAQTFASTKKRRRVVPIQPQLLSWLQTWQGEAEDGSKGPTHGVYGQNYIRDAHVIMKRAGFDWAKPMHTLRKSLESDWLAKYPIADVAAWLGNSPTVAMKHYHQTVGETMRSVTGKNPSPTQTEDSSMS